MIILSSHLNSKEYPLLTRILKQHDDSSSTAFAMSRKSRGCYFLEENSDSAIMLARLFQKFGGKINAYKISDPIIQSDVPRKYYYFVENAFDHGNFESKRWKSHQAIAYQDIWKILNYSDKDLRNKTNGIMLNEVRKLENKVEFGFGGI